MESNKKGQLLAINFYQRYSAQNANNG